MKFVCDRCQTRYSIADEKVRQKILRIRCKTCGNVIVVQDDAGRTTVAAQPPAVVKPGAAGGHAPAVPGSSKGPPAASRAAGPASMPLPRAAKGTDRLGGHAEWHVAIDGVQSGPLARAEVAKRIVAAGAGREILVWKEGMATWKTPREVSVIARELSHLQPTSPSTARPPGSTPAPATHAALSAKPAAPLKSVPTPPPPKAAEPHPEADDFDEAEPAATIIDDTFANEVTTQKSTGPSGSGRAGGADVDFADEVLREVTTRKGKTLSDSASLYTPDPILSDGAATPPPVEPLPPVGAKPAAPPPVRASSSHPAVTSLPTRTPVPHSATATVRPSASHPAVTAVPMPVRTPPPFSAPSARSSVSHAAMPGLPSLAPPALRPSASFGAVPAMRTPPPQAAPARISAPHPAVPTAALTSVPPGMGVSPVPATFPSPIAPTGMPPSPPAASFGPLAPAPVPPTPLPTPIPIDVSDFDMGASSQAADLVSPPVAPPMGLFQRQPGLKYVIAALAIVALIILLGLVILRSEREKPIDPVATAEAERAKAEAERAKADPPQADPPKADPPQPDPPKADPPKVEAPKETKPVPTERPAPPAVVEEKVTSSGGGRRGSRRGGRGGNAARENTQRDKPDSRPPRLTGARPNPFDENRGVSASQLTAVVRDTGNQSALRACYDRALKMDTHLTSGRIDVRVAINMSGSVQRVVINAPSSFMLVEPCIKAAVKRWHFPSNNEEYEYSFPLLMQGGM